MMVTGGGVKGAGRSPYKRAAGEEDFSQQSHFTTILSVFEQLRTGNMLGKSTAIHVEMTSQMPYLAPPISYLTQSLLGCCQVLIRCKIHYFMSVDTLIMA